MAAWYADEIKLGSFDAIKDDVLTIYYGPDADTAQIAQTLSKTISKALMLIKYHVFNYLGQILVFILFPT